MYVTGHHRLRSIVFHAFDSRGFPFAKQKNYLISHHCPHLKIAVCKYFINILKCIYQLLITYLPLNQELQPMVIDSSHALAQNCGTNCRQHIKLLETLESFKSRLKTHLFKIAFNI